MEKGLLWLTVVGIVLHHSGILAVDAVYVRGADTACTVRRERGMLFSLLPFTLFRSMAPWNSGAHCGWNVFLLVSS